MPILPLLSPFDPKLKGAQKTTAGHFVLPSDRRDSPLLAGGALNKFVPVSYSFMMVQFLVNFRHSSCSQLGNTIAPAVVLGASF